MNGEYVKLVESVNSNVLNENFLQSLWNVVKSGKLFPKNYEILDAIVNGETARESLGVSTVIMKDTDSVTDMEKNLERNSLVFVKHSNSKQYDNPNQEGNVSLYFNRDVGEKLGLNLSMDLSGYDMFSYTAPKGESKRIAGFDKSAD